MALALLRGVKAGQNARKVGVGLQQFLERGVPPMKGVHGLLARDARLAAKKFFQLADHENTLGMLFEALYQPSERDAPTTT